MNKKSLILLILTIISIIAAISFGFITKNITGAILFTMVTFFLVLKFVENSRSN